MSRDGVPIEHFSRIQCTVDLLPQDILGFSRYDMGSGDFTFNRGPIFAHFVLADEVNRAPAKVQSALLEAMQERQVSLAGETHQLPTPFMVLATMGYSLNVLTLLAYVLAVGLVVDDAIVVLENIHRRIETGEPVLLAAVRGARQIGFAVVATTIALVAVFVPISLMTGNTGRVFLSLIHI